MIRSSRMVLPLVIAVFLSILAVPPAAAQSCTTNAQCGAFATCQEVFLFFKECRRQLCNFNVDCPQSHRLCVGGICTRPAGGGGGGGGGSSQGIPVSGVGGRCGPQKFGQVTKNVPCRSGLVCTMGRCQLPPS